jgi:septum formation inhibitor-activating ATPase MinD
MPSTTTCDAARRLRGEVVPMIVPSANKGIFNKLFERKADTTIQ